jgi:hypothetical protein
MRSSHKVLARRIERAEFLVGAQVYPKFGRGNCCAPIAQAFNISLLLLESVN